MKASSFSHTDIIGSTIGFIGIVLTVIFYLRGRGQAVPSYAAVKYLLNRSSVAGGDTYTFMSMYDIAQYVI